jgi:hypothetical protein
MALPYSIAPAFEGPLRPSDLIYTRGAILEQTEKTIALDRLDLQKVEFAAAWDGFILRLSLSARLEEWWATRPNKQHHLWLDSSELDDFGTHALVTHPIALKSADTFAAICGWRDVPKAAADLRIRCLGPALIKTHGSAIFPAAVQEIARQFQLEEQPPNSIAVPCRCRLKWGHLWRFSGPSVNEVLDYLNISPPVDISLPVLVKLGANLALVLAFSPSVEEPLRIGVCCQWNAGVVIDDFAAWLRTFPACEYSRTRDLELQWIAPGCFSSLGTAAPEEAIA